LCWEIALGRHRCREEDNIKVGFEVKGCEDAKWIQVAECRAYYYVFLIMVADIYNS
jgi:hypothetical protein